jgi:hypothetical protein
MAKRFISVLLVHNRVAKFAAPHIPEELQSCMKIENQSQHRLTIKKIKKLQQGDPAQKSGPRLTIPSRGATTSSRSFGHPGRRSAISKGW